MDLLIIVIYVIVFFVITMKKSKQARQELDKPIRRPSSKRVDENTPKIPPIIRKLPEIFDIPLDFQDDVEYLDELDEYPRRRVIVKHRRPPDLKPIRQASLVPLPEHLEEEHSPSLEETIGKKAKSVKQEPPKKTFSSKKKPGVFVFSDNPIANAFVLKEILEPPLAYRIKEHYAFGRFFR